EHAEGDILGVQGHGPIDGLAGFFKIAAFVLFRGKAAEHAGARRVPLLSRGRLCGWLWLGDCLATDEGGNENERKSRFPTHGDSQKTVLSAESRALSENNSLSTQYPALSTWHYLLIQIISRLAHFRRRVGHARVAGIFVPRLGGRFAGLSR